MGVLGFVCLYPPFVNHHSATFREIKNMLKKNRIYKKYKNNGFRKADKISLDFCRNECA